MLHTEMITNFLRVIERGKVSPFYLDPEFGRMTLLAAAFLHRKKPNMKENRSDRWR